MVATLCTSSLQPPPPNFVQLRTPRVARCNSLVPYLSQVLMGSYKELNLMMRLLTKYMIFHKWTASSHLLPYQHNRYAYLGFVFTRKRSTFTFCAILNVNRKQLREDRPESKEWFFIYSLSVYVLSGGGCANQTRH